MVAPRRPRCRLAQPPSPPIPSAEISFIFLELVLGNLFRLGWSLSLCPLLMQLLAVNRRWRLGLPMPSQLQASHSGTCIWVERPDLGIFLFLHRLAFLAQSEAQVRRGRLGFFITFNEFGVICCRFLNFPFGEKSQKNSSPLVKHGSWSKPLLSPSQFLA